MNLRDAALGEVNIFGLWLICYHLNLIMVLHVLKSPFNGLSFHKSFESGPVRVLPREFLFLCLASILVYCVNILPQNIFQG